MTRFRHRSISMTVTGDEQWRGKNPLGLTRLQPNAARDASPTAEIEMLILVSIILPKMTTFEDKPLR